MYHVVPSDLPLLDLWRLFVHRAVVLPLVAFVCLTLTACPPIEGIFDLSGLPDGQYGEVYTGKVAIAEYDGPAAFTLVSGELPAGLAMDEAGNITGTPEYAGPVTLTVLASGMKRIEDFQDTVTFSITADHLPDAFLGYFHDQLTNMTERSALAPGGPQRQREMWVRVAETGQEGMTEWTIRPGIYLPGPNGVPEKGQDDQLIDGLYDDVRIGDIDFGDLEVAFGGWSPTYEDYLDPPSYPSQHIPEDSPPTVSGDGVIRAGADTGGATIELTHPDFGSVDAAVQVVPPDWCPKGDHPEGGPGDDGFCA